MSIFQKKYHINIHQFKTTNEVLNNPNRGFHRIVLLDISKEALNEFYLSNYPFDLVLVEFNLKSFSKINLSECALSNISKSLEIIKKANKHTIVRFAYDFEGNGMRNEPSSIQRILSHIEQIKPILMQYKETIYLLQGLFVGSWGEMHHSKFLSENALNQLYQKLNMGIYLSVRTPALHRMLNDFNVGIFNDGFCSSEDDLGTYPENRQQDYQYQSKIKAPMGGETACLSSYNDIENVIHSMRELHFSYLNEEYHPEVIEKWKKVHITIKMGLIIS